MDWSELTMAYICFKNLMRKSFFDGKSFFFVIKAVSLNILKYCFLWKKTVLLFCEKNKIWKKKFWYKKLFGETHFCEIRGLFKKQERKKV